MHSRPASCAVERRWNDDPVGFPLLSGLAAAALLLLLVVVGTLVVGVLALVLGRFLDQFLRVFGEVVAFDPRQRVVLEIQDEVLGFHAAVAAADRRDVIPAALLERADY